MFENSRQIDFFDRKDVDGQVSVKTGNRLDYLYSLFREFHTIGDWTLDLKTGEARWSDEVYRIHGFKPADGPLPPDQVNSLIEMFEASDAKVVRKLVDAAAKTGQGYQFRLRLNARDGKTRLVESIGGAIKDENGEVVDKTPELQESSGWGESVRNQDADVIHRLKDGSPWSMQDHRQLLNLQRLIDGCYESARTEREVVF